VVNVRVDDHPEPLAELRRLAVLTRIYRTINIPLERVAAGDHSGAIEAAREVCSQLPDDSNARLRLGITLAVVGDPEGSEILAVMAEESDKWLVYVRGLCLHYQIDPNPVLDGLR
jgi:hypothetical protein